MYLMKEATYKYINSCKMFKNHHLEIKGGIVKLYQTAYRIIVIDLTLGTVDCMNNQGLSMPLKYEELTSIKHIFYLEYKECPKHQFKKKN